MCYDFTGATLVLPQSCVCYDFTGATLVLPQSLRPTESQVSSFPPLLQSILGSNPGIAPILKSHRVRSQFIPSAPPNHSGFQFASYQDHFLFQTIAWVLRVVKLGDTSRPKKSGLIRKTGIQHAKPGLG